MYKKHNFSATLQGKVMGELWDGREGWREFSVVLDDGKQSISRAVKKQLSADFHNAEIDPDTLLAVTLIKPNRRITRYFYPFEK